MSHIDHKERDAKKVEQMFSSIAPRYDLLNHVLSFGLDFGWRRKVARETARIDCRRILDVCTGTGDMAVDLSRFWKGRAFVEGIDFSRELLAIAREKAKKAGLDDKITFREGNAERLPYENEQFDAVTITFGLRNINNREYALREFLRVTRSGGCFVCLEFSRPTTLVFQKTYSFYLLKIVPFISRIFGSNSAAYEYLGNTIRDFPPPAALAGLIESAGWKNVAYKKLAGGIVAIHRGEKKP
jgi:demethylmenaquinone methyltransferase/2-methoxy-6-polyprenyl-1,4-benzoquinol methylase